MQIDEFLSINPVARDIDPGLLTADDRRNEEATVEFLAFILSHSDRSLRILHLGTEYIINKEDVVSVSTPAVIFGSFGKAGRAAKIELKAHAVIRPAKAARAAQFFASLPFAFLVPSWADSVDRRAFQSARDTEWLIERGLLAPTGHHGGTPPSLAQSPLTDVSTPGHSIPSHSGTAVGTFPDIHVVAGDEDDTETTPDTSGDEFKNDEGY